MAQGPVMRGEFLELVPHTRIVLSFGWEAADGVPPVAPGSTRVEITLVADADDTIMTLRHGGLPGAAIGEHRSGWTHFLPLLARAAGRPQHQDHRGRVMKIPKPTEPDRERFAVLVPDAPGVEVKPMFGNLGAFVNGNMFMGLFGADIGIKLPEPDRQRLLAEPGAGPFGPSERPMGGYVTLPASWSARRAKRWIDTSLAHVASLPSKKTKSTGTKHS